MAPEIHFVQLGFACPYLDTDVRPYLFVRAHTQTLSHTLIRTRMQAHPAGICLVVLWLPPRAEAVSIVCAD